MKDTVSKKTKGETQKVVSTTKTTVTKTGARTSDKTTSTTDKTTSKSSKTVTNDKFDGKLEMPSVTKDELNLAATRLNGARLDKIPKLVTKDTNTIEIDNRIFDDESEIEEPIVSSKTIDGQLLSSERMTKKTKLKRKVKNVNLSQAERINTDYQWGLSLEQVAQREEDGYINVTNKTIGKTYKSILFSNIFTFFNLLTFVVAGALIAVGAGVTQLFFMFIIGANILIGIIQEFKAKRAVDKLNLITAPSAIVIRNGERTPIPVGEVALDDIVYLEMGKQICADCIVVKGECEVNESMLTGESIPVKKGIGAVMYAGSFVSSGSVYARVDKVGAANYVETLTSYAKKYRKPKSELQNSIRLIIKAVSMLIIPLATIMIYVNFRSSQDWFTTISKTSGAVIGMIPAGMFLLTSLALAISVVRLAKRKTLVQDLYCIEMLARVDVLCLDKTGTITDGTMQVNNIIEIKGGDTEYSISDIVGSMLTATEDNNQTALALADKFGYNSKLKPKSILPFSSQRKLSAVTFEGAGTYMLGAPEFVLKDMGVRIEKIITENAANGFRVMVLAHSPADIVGSKLPAVRRPMCLLVIEDHIREDAIETIAWFKDNDVAVKVISGDNPITVSEVAKRVGVVKAELYISLDGLSNQEVIEAANKYTVFGRVSPEQKALLIKAIKAKGHTVAMTGDGVNDILAMREADCSVAIASGAEAARNVSHLVLLDSNFTSMPDVVMEGRRVINNIQRSSSLFLMKTIMSIMLSIIFLALRKEYPFYTSHLLPLEICVIAFPSFALALQSNKNRIQGKFLANVISRALPGGIVLVINVMAIFLFNQLFYQATVEQYTAMLVISITFTGLMILAKICEPFNAYRTVLMVLAAVITTAVIILLPNIGVVPLDMVEFFFVTTLILASYFILSVMVKITANIKFSPGEPKSLPELMTKERTR